MLHGSRKPLRLSDNSYMTVPNTARHESAPGTARVPASSVVGRGTTLVLRLSTNAVTPVEEIGAVEHCQLLRRATTNLRVLSRSSRPAFRRVSSRSFGFIFSARFRYAVALP
jgi:hypothetical protein